MLIIDVGPQVLFQDGINSLGLAISLMMEAGGEVLGDADKFAQGPGEYRGKLGTSIGYNGVREAMEPEDVIKIQAGHLFGVRVLPGWNIVRHLG